MRHFQNFAFIDEETGLINKLKGNADYFFEDVRSVAVGCLVAAIFDPVEKGYDWLVNIVRGAKDSVVFLKIRKGDVGVGAVQVIQDGAGGGEAVSNVLVSEGADEHFNKSRKKNLSYSLVGAIILFEECGGGVESISKFGDLGAGGVGWDDGFRAGDDRHDEGDIRQGIVDSG